VHDTILHHHHYAKRYTGLPVRYSTLHHITGPILYRTEPNCTMPSHNNSDRFTFLWQNRTKLNLTVPLRSVTVSLIFTRHDVTIPHLTTTVPFRTKPHTTLPFAICKHNQTSPHIARLCLTIASPNTDIACLADTNATRHNFSNTGQNDTLPYLVNTLPIQHATEQF